MFVQRLIVGILVFCGSITMAADAAAPASRTSINELGFPIRDIPFRMPLAQARAAWPFGTDTGQNEDTDGDGRDDYRTALVDIDSTGAIRLSAQSGARSFSMLEVKRGGQFDSKRYVGASGAVRATMLKVPAAQEQDSGWATFEGPVWESDRVGYRFYLDDRNLTDIFGKRRTGPVLAEVADDYHKIADWGADILKVGQSLGLGSPAIWTNQGARVISGAHRVAVRIAENGPLVSRIVVDHRAVPIAGRRANVRSNISIHGGTRASEHALTVSGVPGVMLATGIVRHPAAVTLKTGTEAGFFYVYTWGRQSDQMHLLGMAVLVPADLAPEVVEGDVATHIVRFRPQSTKGSARGVYRYLAGWELEADPITSEEQFLEAVREEARRWRLELANMP